MRADDNPARTGAAYQQIALAMVKRWLLQVWAGTDVKPYSLDIGARILILYGCLGMIFH